MAQPSTKHRIQKIVSGGQTGADRGALDAALSLGIEHGGWCPKGRLAEDGVIPERYCLTETSSKYYRIRTEQNVIDSDGTLIFYYKSLRGGTELTRQMASKHRKPFLLVDLARTWEVDAVQEWLELHKIAILNVAGPRESSNPGIALKVRKLIMQSLTREPLIDTDLHE
jgi:hypothetical protein